MYSSRIIFFCCSVALILFAGALHWTVWADACKAYAMLISYGLIFLGCLGAWAGFPDGLRISQKVGLILFISLIARLSMMGIPESDDVYRYLWEGKLVAAGESPYAYPANHPYYLSYRDAYWEAMNHKDKLTVYPPLTEWLFAVIGSVAYTPWAFKIFFIIADLCAIGVLIALCSRYELAFRNVLIYALNPLALFAIAGEAHFDALLILAILLSVWFGQDRKFSWAWFWLGMAIQIKIIAIALLPLYLWRCQWQKSWIILIPLAVPSLHFMTTLPGLLQGLWHFGGLSAFNGPIHGPLSALLAGNTASATVILMVLFGVVVLWIIRSIASLPKAVYLTLAALVLFLPVVHYWYILWVIPFIVMFPGLSWLVLSFTSGAYFFSVFSAEQGEEWMLPIWAMWMIWLPFLLLLAYELRIAILRRLCPDEVWRKPETLAVVVPALNEERQIKTCLSSLKFMQPPPDEIIVCDGGSNDRTVAVAKTMNVHVVTGGAGRGAQIRAGIAAASSDVVLVIHADCRCDMDVRRRIMVMLERNADVVGGAVGQRFMASSAKLLVIELLNDMRATFAGASFGDQGQFFRVTALTKVGGFPDYPLMEDVELSLRLGRVGRTVLLDGGIQNSERQWKQHFFKRIGLILRLVSIFHVNRLLRRDVTAQLYAKYYKRNEYRGCDNIRQK
jgi:hypothetical protein